MGVATEHIPLTHLQDELLANVLSYSAPRDVEAMTVACKVIPSRILPQFPIWKQLFCRRWQMLNFALEPEAMVEIDTRLKRKFPSHWNESRMFQFLAHAITPVPSYADIKKTRYMQGHQSIEHIVEALSDSKSSRRVVDFAFAGHMLGGDRAVRANVPFAVVPHVVVFRRQYATEKHKPYYVIGIVSSGYFEISIIKRSRPQIRRFHGSDMTAIGVATSRFHLVDRQPGWDGHSYGYHGDDGNFFHRNGTVRGQHFGPAFNADDTVGCGVRRDVSEQQSFVFFTNNGELLPNGEQGMACRHVDWYPVVGLDSCHQIHINFGQECFCYDAIVDEMLEECADLPVDFMTRMQWYPISDSDEDDDDDDDLFSDSDTPDDDERMRHFSMVQWIAQRAAHQIDPEDLMELEGDIEWFPSDASDDEDEDVSWASDDEEMDPEDIEMTEAQQEREASHEA